VKTFAHKTHHLLWFGALVMVMALGAGCAVHRHAYMVPAPTDNLTNGGHSATAALDGVSITVTPNAWDGRPRDLYRRVTPLKVRLENHNNRPLRLVYEDFDLQTAQGQQLAALPPSEIRGRQYIGQNRMPFDPHFVETAWQDRDRDHDVGRDHGTRVIVTPGFYWDNFYYAPYWTYGYAGLGPWPYAWAPDVGYYNTYYQHLRAIHLPTQSMLRKAIPEGVIAPGGYVQGFLFFEKVNPEMDNVTFIAKLQGAHSGQQFGLIKIPFEVKSK